MNIKINFLLDENFYEYSYENLYEHKYEYQYEQLLDEHYYQFQNGPEQKLPQQMINGN